MKGNGNAWSTLFQKIYFMTLPSSGQRTKYIVKHANLFKHIGKGLFWQPRSFPSDPEFISIGDNVYIASGVEFINHDIIPHMLKKKYHTDDFAISRGCIEIDNNVMIGAKTIVLPDVKIGRNVIIGAGSVVVKDIPDNCVAAGVPCRVVGDFNLLVDKYKKRRN
ncbi:acyltransferase [Prevotella communis]|uniref:acyltransferase n=1 Tax=Prevotella communis TaxID=2913614 RepID=UPI001EDA5F24|nr:acyltransferase [Prevotella communis]UKK59597.1 acyltransferase [Prevotella communis]